MPIFTVSLFFKCYSIFLVLLTWKCAAGDFYSRTDGNRKFCTSLKGGKSNERCQETVTGFKKLITQQDLEFYEFVSRNSSSIKTQLDAFLLLSFKILYHKMETLSRFAKSEEGIAKILLSDTKDEIERIATLQWYYYHLNDTHFDVTNICTLRNKIFTQILIFVENLIDLKVMLSNLQTENTELANILKEDIQFNLKSQSYLYNCLDSLYTYIEDNVYDYDGEQNCEYNAKPYIKILKEFVIFILENDFNNKLATFKNYNKFILKLAVVDFPRKSFEIVKLYSELLITKDNFLLSFIDEICNQTCNSQQVANLFLLLETFPVGDDSVKAINYLIKLYKLVATNYTKGHKFREWSVEVLTIGRIVERQRFDPAFKLIETSTKNEFLCVERLISNWTETFKRTFAYYISESELERNHWNTVYRMMKQEFYAINYNSFRWWLPEIVTKLLYDVMPNKVDKICIFINMVYGRQMTKRIMYGKLLDILMSGDNIYSMEILRVAHYISTHVDEEYFAPLKNKLPSEIRQIMWNKTCKIKNIANNVYLFLANSYFINSKEFNSSKEYLKLLGGNKSTFLPKFQWHFEYDLINNTFYIMENSTRLYLSVGKRFGDKTFRLRFKTKIEQKAITKWKLQIVKDYRNISNRLIFQLITSNNPPEYLYVEKNMLDNDTQRVFVSQLKKNSVNSLWTLICTNSEEKHFHRVERSNHVHIGKTFSEDVEKIENSLIRYEYVDDFIFSFIKRINFERFLHTKENYFTSDHSMYQILSGFVRKSLKFSYLQSLELVEFSSFLNKSIITNEKLYKHNLIETIKEGMLRTLSGYEYLLNMSVRNTGYPLEEFNLCDEALDYVTKYMSYLQIGSKITTIIASDQYLRASINFNTVFPSSASKFSNYYNYFLKNKIRCLNKFNVFRYNFGKNYSDRSGITRSLLMNITTDTFLNMQFRVGAVYFTVFNNESVIFEIFENLLDHNYYINTIIYEYFVVFIAHLFNMQNLNLNKENILNYSYMRLNSSSRITDCLRHLYNSIAQKYVTDNASNSTLTDALKVNLDNIINDKNLRLMEFSELVLKRNMNVELIIRLVNHLMKCYFNQIFQMTYYIFSQMNETDFNSDQVTIFYSSFPKEVREDSFDWTIRLMISSSGADHVEAVKFAQYVYTTYGGYIPCYHTGCVKDLEFILPGYAKNFFNSKVCYVRDSKHFKSLFISKPNFVNFYKEGQQDQGLILEIRNSYTGLNYDWVFEYVKENDTFLMKSRERNLYVALGKRLGDSENYKLKLVTSKYINPIEWKVELHKNFDKFMNVFKFRPAQFNKIHLYLHAAVYGGTSEMGTVLLSNLKLYNHTEDRDVWGHAEVWGAYCL